MAFGVKQQNLPALIQSLAGPAVWPHPVGDISLIETHISWIVLTGDYAYKIKRPLNLGFLDFTTLERRRHACLEELRLNRRTAPSLYLGVVALCGSEDAPEIVNIDEDPDDVIEYAVRMREFPQEQQLDRYLAAGSLGGADMEALAGHVAGFHQSIPPAGADRPRDDVAKLTRFCRGNFDTLAELIDDSADVDTLQRLRDWTESQLATLAQRIGQRREDGFVRECHGDLHLSNLVRLDSGFAAFDCIEFDPDLRWMDVISEMGYLVMDLAARQRVDLAWRLLNRYLELTGDYQGVVLLRLYIVYASMVRAKIAAIHAEQEESGSAAFMEQARHYRMHLALAERAIRPRRPVLLITHGLSGSGKTWLSSRLASALPAIRIRSDVERKRLAGLAPADRSDSPVGGGLYDEETTGRTYVRLRDCASAVLTAQFDCIVDAACLKSKQRRLFADLARDAGAELLILECKASESVLRERIMQRAWDGADASEADWSVLRNQIGALEELDDDERRHTITIDCSDTIDALRVTGAICSKLGRDAGD